MANKESVYLIISVNSSMGNNYSDDKTRLDVAVESCSHMIRQKLLFNPKDYIGILINGCNESENDLNKENILMFREAKFPELSLLKDIYRLKPTDCENGDVLESIEVALDSFDRIHGKKKWTKRIFLLTDGDTPINDHRVEKIANMINLFDVRVNIITINFFNEIDEDVNELDDEQKLESIETDNQKKSKKTLKNLMELSSNVKVFTANMASKIYRQFKKKRIKPYVKFRGPLYFSDNLYLDINVFSKVVKSDIPSLKKFSLACEYDEDTKANEVTMEKLYYLNDDPNQKPLEKEFVTKAYYYGKGLVPVSETDQVLFKNEEGRSMKVIGFTDKFRVPRHHYIGGSDIVVPSVANSNNDKIAIHGLVQEMIKTNKVLICRFVTRANADPHLVVLNPHMTSNGAVFYLNNLPTVEDIRDFQFESLNECTVKQEEVVSKFIDTLDLDAEEEDSEKIEKLKPNNVYNPTLQYFYQCLEHRVLNDENNLPKLDETIEDYMRPDKKLFENNKYVSFLPRVFDIKQKDQEEKKKRVFWREIIKNEMNENVEETNRRLEEKLEKNKEEAKKIISTHSPMDDFKEMINYRYEDLTMQAMDQLKNIIIKFILESFKGSYYIKAIDCLKTLRDACVEEDEVDFFNAFLQELKHDFPKEKFMEIWKLIIENKITLISLKENVKSKYSEDDAIQWLSMIDKKEVITSTLNDLDQLIDDIE